MDVGFYLGELLMEQGEVNVPGLGYFVKARMGGYYDEAERKFYPPFHQAQFDGQFIEDEALATYIARKKNISVASAKYFAEKYIGNLKLEALQQDVPIGDMGWFYTDSARLAFRPADKLAGDDLFYGLPHISINKTGHTKPFEEQPDVEFDAVTFNFEHTPSPAPVEVAEPVEPEALAQETVALPPDVPAEEITYVHPPNEPVVSLDLEVEEYQPDNNKRTLVFLAVIFGSIALICAAIFAVNYYRPDVFAKIVSWNQQTPKPADTVKPKVIVPVKPDTGIKDSVKADTAAIKKDPVTKVIAPVAKAPVVTTPPVTVVPKLPVGAANTTDLVAALIKEATEAGVPISPAVGTKRFEVSVATVKSMKKVKVVIDNLKSKGLNAWYTPDFTGPFKHVSIGYFATEKEAKALAVKSIESGKVSGDAYAIEINPQK